MSLSIFDRRESEVRSYTRTFPAVFERSKGAYLYDTAGKAYIDFFAGAGTLNYGHNDERIKQAVIDYLQADGVVHGLDMATVARRRFHEAFERIILQPRALDYKVQFPGPTGTNAVEAALKLARRVTGRATVVAFTGSYHGLSTGALAVTSGRPFRHPAYTCTNDVVFMPFDGFLGEETDTLSYLTRFFEDDWSGLDLPAAVLVEVVQAEGGVQVAGTKWLRGLAELCLKHDTLLIIDDIQVGNGRTGTFFSFEPYGLVPDIVVLSKAIGGLGLPLSINLLKPELDQWKPGEHSGTFRANNLALVAASAALSYWETDRFATEVMRKGEKLDAGLRGMQSRYPDLKLQVRGRGLIYGTEIPDPALAGAVAREAFRQGLLVELCGSKKNVLKCIPPLVINDEELERGLSIIERSLQKALQA